MHNPIELIQNQWRTAKASKDANANFCTLATVSSSAEVSVRTLVLRKITSDSFIIYINSTSPKWTQLASSQSFELLIFWPSLMQQYRIRGEHCEISRQNMAQHWANKPYDSKILDHYYERCQPQTSIIDSRDSLHHAIESLKRTYPQGSDIPFPKKVKGVSIKANYIEAWSSSPSALPLTNQSGLHERYLYTLSKDTWTQQVLVP